MLARSLALLLDDCYLIDDPVASPTDLFKDFVIVVAKVGEISILFVIFLVLGHLFLLTHQALLFLIHAASSYDYNHF